jgi:ABC-type branched-subunit amino acid transport system substrate-binding protein
VESSLLTLAIMAVIGVVMSMVTLTPPAVGQPSAAAVAGATGGTADGATAVGADPAARGDAGGQPAAAAAQPAAGGAATAARPGGTTPAAGSTCAAGRNGGATDVGVTGTSILLAATTVLDGPGASFLSTERLGLSAVVDRVNRGGGICGRIIQLSLRNDSWNGQLGQQYIQNFVDGDHVFALASSDSEGLRAAGKYIEQKQVPVVGTDGMLQQQYTNPWIWPVATSTTSTMHVIAKNGHDRGAKVFGIVFDDQYHFGVEGAYAYDQAVRRLTGSDVNGYNASLNTCTKHFCGIDPGKSSYAVEAHEFSSCFDACDLAAVLLEPDTALSFLSNGRSRTPPVGLMAAQPLFTTDLARNCSGSCDGMWVWTGYNPPVGQLAGLPGVQQYVQDVRRESSSVDVTNQFLEGAYDGMNLMVEALRKCGPALTRQGLRQVLDSMTFDSGLSDPLSWRPGKHYANVKARAFAIHYSNRFDGFGDTQSGWVTDPWVGQDIRAGE